MKRKKRTKLKKAASPLVSTVLLIMIVIVLALIILLWSGVFLKEAITKEIGGKEKTTEQYCSEINIETFINDDGSFGFRNTGNVPIYSVNLKFYNRGGSDIVKINPSNGGAVNPGFSTTFKDPANPNVFFNYYDYEQVKIIPIILGESESGEIQEFECPEKYGIII